MQAAIQEEEETDRYKTDAELARKFQEEEAEREAKRKSGVGDELDQASAALIEKLNKEWQVSTESSS